jgi:hypothetical protein
VEKNLEPVRALKQNDQRQHPLHLVGGKEPRARKGTETRQSVRAPRAWLAWVEKNLEPVRALKREVRPRMAGLWGFEHPGGKEPRARKGTETSFS